LVEPEYLWILPNYSCILCLTTWMVGLLIDFGTEIYENYINLELKNLLDNLIQI